MLIALAQSPITAQQFNFWNDQLQKDEILVREIIDIDTNYMEDEIDQVQNKKMLVKQIKKRDLVKEMMMILIPHLLQWKQKLNQKF